MKYHQTPRPLIEEHYHIQMLIEGQEKRSEDRKRHQDADKERQERNDEIRAVKDVEVRDFWCTDCKEDFKRLAVKQVETDWNNSNQYIAFYKSKHKACGKWCIRFITDKYKDPFWAKSRLVKLDQGRHYEDIIQPHQTGFNLLYGKK